MEIRSTVMRYMVKKKRKDKEEENELESEITFLESKINITDDEIHLILQKRNKLQNLREKIIDGIILRSKARWISQGEKVTKYVCNLEKRYFVSKQMYTLINEFGEEITKKKQ